MPFVPPPNVLTRTKSPQMGHGGFGFIEKKFNFFFKNAHHTNWVKANEVEGKLQTTVAALSWVQTRTHPTALTLTP